MKTLPIRLLFFFALSMNAQIGIGTNTPKASSVLELNSTKLGFLLPRIGLTSATDITTIASPAKGLIVYNKASAGLAPAGLYQWNGSLWSPIADNVSAPFHGDVSGNTNSNTVLGIQKKPLLFTTPSPTQLLRFNGTSWVNSNDVSSQNWLLTGNTFTTSSNFLGTTDDIKMTLKSFNQPFFEFGRRKTLGLTQGYTDYTNDNQLVTHLRSAIQFEAPNALIYKPMFYVDGYGNFRLKGSAAGDDYFEIGAAGTVSNNGSVEFIIGDDGDEPIVFQKYNNTTKIEMLRMQGTGLNTEVRVGINNNFAVANSVLQTNGSIAKSITSTSSSITLSDSHYTVIFNGGDATIGVTLPTASTTTGRTYVIRNTSGASKNITGFINETGATINTIPNNTVIWIQSDGSNWISI
ncbi:hypothetical protein [Flavobacterium sp.]|uniref:hypothetical protein n=1 Tax=Flavobacterium sp. TaxID=239 RepID=UPI003750305F